MPTRALLRAAPFLAALALALNPGGEAAAAEPSASAVAAAEHQREVEAFRAERLAGLKSPDGWLSLVGLFWLEEGENRIGSDPEGKVIFPSGKAPARAGVLVRQGNKVSLKAATGAGITVEGQPVIEVELASGKDAKPVIADLGSLSFFVIHRGDRVGVRVRDRESPALASFKDIENFPLNPALRVEARFEPYDPPKPIAIANIIGIVEDQLSPGAVVFEHGGKTWRLDALEGADGELFLLFADGTSGEETYGAGRFLDTKKPVNGKVVVDFNLAYNPPCVFTPYATCPLPPRQNRLAMRVEAGEKNYRAAH